MKPAKKQVFKTTTVAQALKMGPRRFVKEYLFPTMRREHGVGFAMSSWHIHPSKMVSDDSIDDITIRDRGVPTCDSVMCIGGTMQAILGTKVESRFAQVLGLPLYDDNHESAHSLFYNWHADRGPWAGLVGTFNFVKTPQEKERIAEKAVMAAIKIGERRKKSKSKS